MKYALFLYGKNRLNSNNQYANVGDCFQTIAVENLYSLIGVDKDSICTVKREYLSQTKEKCILPMQGYFTKIKGMTDIYPIPSSIVPVYIGYHDLFYDNKKLLKKKKEYLLCHSPIGCRDEKTFQMFQKFGIPSYISGCLTITLPRRDNCESQRKVLLVDAPKGIEKFIPDKLRKNVEYVTQEIPYINGYSYEENAAYIREQAERLLNKYRNEAKLVVTSRLHVAAPCIGMGIPVILARNYFDDRYGWIDRYIPLYTPEKFEHINWDVSSIDISYEKKLLLKLFRGAVDGNVSDEVISEVHDLYYLRKKTELSMPFTARAYKRMQAINPTIADFIREKVLQPFTVATARRK